MDFREKVLYHQIYPGKLLADASASVLSLYFFWRHKPVAALLATVLPPVLASWIIIQRVDLEKYKHSSLGKYLNTYTLCASSSLTEELDGQVSQA